MLFNSKKNKKKKELDDILATLAEATSDHVKGVINGNQQISTEDWHRFSNKVCEIINVSLIVRSTKESSGTVDVSCVEALDAWKKKQKTPFRYKSQYRS
jgi:hypothetical protein